MLGDSDCSRCGTPVSVGPFSTSTPVCKECRAFLATPEGKAEAQREKLMAAAMSIDDRPWWLCSRREVTVRYDSEEQLQFEMPLAAERAWEIVSASATEGHVNVGRIIVLGAASLLTPLRSKGFVLVVWRRAEHGSSEGDGGERADPVEVLRKLKEMLDLDLITDSEYEAKKREVLDRM